MMKKAHMHIASTGQPNTGFQLSVTLSLSLVFEDVDLPLLSSPPSAIIPANTSPASNLTNDHYPDNNYSSSSEHTLDSDKPR